ncbi:MAG: hypothetical protein JKY33_05365, partial [Bacteroidia bacterium]|nr:hypothetical protein [Bacteroidia bacterium]
MLTNKFKRTVHLFLIVLLGTFCSSVVSSFAQTGIPFIYYYSPKEYAAKNEEYNSGTQNWSITQDKRGVMYFGNNDGVLIYDGIHWRMVTTSNGTTVRSLTVDINSRVYVGAIGDFGYLTTDSTGRTNYVSLIDKIPEEYRSFKDIWAIHATEKAIYFREYKAIYKWDGESIKVISAGEGRFRSSFTVGDGFYIYERQQGLIQMTEDDQFLPVMNGEMFEGMKIYTMLPYGESEVLIGTKDIGFFVYDGIEFEPFPTDIDDFIKAKRIYNGTRLKDGRYAIGTLAGGLAIIDASGKLSAVFNKSTGLQDETIITSYVDYEGGLWLGLNNGLARIEVPSPLTSVSDQRGLEGKVLSIIRHKGILYAGTSNGLFLHEEVKNNEIKKGSTISDDLLNFKRIEGFQSQTRHLLGHEDVILAAVPSIGVYQIKNNEFTTVVGDPSFYIYKVKDKNIASFKEPEKTRAFVGMQNGLGLISYENGEWKFDVKIANITEQVWSIVEDDRGNLWLGTLYQGVLRINFKEGGIENPTIERYGVDHNLPSGWVEVYSVINKTYYATDKGLYGFDYDKNRFYRDTTFFKEQALDNELEMYCLVADMNNNIWMRCDKEIRVAVPQYTNGVLDSFLISRIPFLRIPKSKANVIYPDNDNITWIAGPDGLIRYDVKVAKNYNVKFNALIRTVTLGKDSVVFHGTYFSQKGNVSLKQPEFLSPNLSYEYNSITFEYAAATFDNDKANKFQYFLDGFDNDWSDLTKETKKEYTNLPEGTYTFRVRARNVYEMYSNEATYSFTISPPWYRTTFAYIGYLIFFISIIYGAIRYNVRRLEQANKRLQAMIDEATVEIRDQKEDLEEKSKDILASIRYAKKIQDTILPMSELIEESLPDSFVLFKPK